MQKTLLIIGGSGNLGRSVINNFKNGWKIANIDLKENQDSQINIIINPQLALKQQMPEIKQALKKFQPQNYDAVICTAGGWTGGSIKENTIFETYEKMHQFNVMTSLIAAHLTTHFLNQNGLFVLTGAGGIINSPCHDMIAYALSKTAVHTLAQNMANSTYMPENSRVITILPKVIDTPENREAMPKSDFSTWAQPDQIAGLLRMWADGNNLPKNGSLALLNVSSNSIVPEFI